MKTYIIDFDGTLFIDNFIDEKFLQIQLQLNNEVIIATNRSKGELLDDFYVDTEHLKFVYSGGSVLEKEKEIILRTFEEDKIRFYLETVANYSLCPYMAKVNGDNFIGSRDIIQINNITQIDYYPIDNEQKGFIVSLSSAFSFSIVLKENGIISIYPEGVNKLSSALKLVNPKSSKVIALGNDLNDISFLSNKLIKGSICKTSYIQEKGLGEVIKKFKD